MESRARHVTASKCQTHNGHERRQHSSDYERGEAANPQKQFPARSPFLGSQRYSAANAEPTLSRAHSALQHTPTWPRRLGALSASSMQLPEPVIPGQPATVPLPGLP
jgi:hypothetical protein